MDDAISEVQKVLELNPDDYGARCDLGNLYSRRTGWMRAMGQFQKVEDMNPAYTEAQNDRMRMIWALATSPDDTVRNGAKARELAQAMVNRSGGAIPVQLSILAAAQAESGHYEEAVATGERAGQLALQRRTPNWQRPSGNSSIFIARAGPITKRPRPHRRRRQTPEQTRWRQPEPPVARVNDVANETGGAGLPADAGNSHTRRTVWVITLGLVTGVIGLLALAPTMAGRSATGGAGAGQRRPGTVFWRRDLICSSRTSRIRDSNSTNANAAH